MDHGPVYAYGRFGPCISAYNTTYSFFLLKHPPNMFMHVEPSLLGDSGGVVNSLDFCPASLKSLGCFYFRCVLSSAVTVNLRILHCQF